MRRITGEETSVPKMRLSRGHTTAWHLAEEAECARSQPMRLAPAARELIARGRQLYWVQTTIESGCRRSDHNVLLLGPPRVGQSMLARRLTTIVPAMSLAEALETTCIHRVAGRTGARTAVVTRRPCRAPPHTISDVGLIGGGRVPMPGEVSLAHHGILCLDELPECRRHVLEGLRQPLEESLIYIQSPELHKFL